MRDIFVVNSRRIIKSFRIISRCAAAVQAYFLRDITRVLSDNKDPNTNCCAARIRRLRNCCKTNRILSDSSDTWVYQFYFHWCCPTPVTKVNYRISENMEKNILPPAKICHSFWFLFGDFKIKLERSEQWRFVKMFIFLVFFWKVCKLLRLLDGNWIASKHSKLFICFYEWQLTSEHLVIQTSLLSKTHKLELIL